MSNPIIPHDEPAPDGTAGTDGTQPRRHYLELPRGITLKRFVNTGYVRLQRKACRNSHRNEL